MSVELYYTNWLSPVFQLHLYCIFMIFVEMYSDHVTHLLLFWSFGVFKRNVLYKDRWKPVAWLLLKCTHYLHMEQRVHHLTRVTNDLIPPTYCRLQMDRVDSLTYCKWSTNYVSPQAVYLSGMPSHLELTFWNVKRQWTTVNVACKCRGDYLLQSLCSPSSLFYMLGQTPHSCNLVHFPLGSSRAANTGNGSWQRVSLLL